MYLPNPPSKDRLRLKQVDPAGHPGCSLMIPSSPSDPPLQFRGQSTLAGSDPFGSLPRHEHLLEPRHEYLHGHSILGAQHVGSTSFAIPKDSNRQFAHLQAICSPVYPGQINWQVPSSQPVSELEHGLVVDIAIHGFARSLEYQSVGEEKNRSSWRC